MRVAQVAEELLQVVEVRIGVAVEVLEQGGGEVRDVDAGAGGEGGRVEARAVGVLVGVEEDVGAIVFVVAGADVESVLAQGGVGAERVVLTLGHSGMAAVQGCWGARSL